MAKKNEKAIYAPGELDRVRDNLGQIDQNEAKRMAQVLGGEVGYERAKEPPAQSVRKQVKRENVDMTIAGNTRSAIPSRRVETVYDDDLTGDRKPLRTYKPDPKDDPSIPLKILYLNG